MKLLRRLTTKKAYSPAKLDNRLSENVEDIRQIHKARRGNNQNYKMELTPGETCLAEVKIQRGIRRRYVFTITICNSNDATQSHT